MDAVTVVIPTRNRPDLLRATLASVLRQRRVELHVIIVDDGGSIDLNAVVSPLDDHRVTVERHAIARGVSAARNRGVARATTEWVAFCDDDDLWSPDKLWRQVASFGSSGRDWGYAGCVLVDAQLNIHGGTPPLLPEALASALYTYNAVPAGASNVIVRRQVFQRLGGFDEALTHVPDWDLWLRLARHGLAACVTDPLVGYRIHAGNASFRTTEMLGELALLERRYGLRQARCRFYRHLAHLCLRANRRREALTYFARALVRFRDGYGRLDLEMDWRLLSEHAGEVVRHRLGRPLSKRALQRVQAARERDPHAGWKSQAERWLGELPG